MPFDQLKNVSFCYKYSERNVVDNVNVSIPVGSRIALVGRTGSGKTTIAHLLLGLLQPTSGQLLLDGISVSDKDLPAWQANCSLVPQDIRLLDGSIRENVAFGLDDASINDDDVWAALKTAQFDDVVAQMPYGLYTMIGENGVKLSGGQRQRLSLLVPSTEVLASSFSMKPQAPLITKRNMTSCRLWILLVDVAPRL